MTNVMGFEELLHATLHERVDVTEPRGFLQRMMARLAQAESMPQEFVFGGIPKPARESRSMWMALATHAVVVLLVFGIMRSRGQVGALSVSLRELQQAELHLPLPPRPTMAGGGGGAHDNEPVTQGRLPQAATQPIVPTKAPPMIEPKLPVQPTIVADMKMPDSIMPNMGVPSSILKGFSLGNGSGGGIGTGTGNGIGPGSGGATGGGLYHVGGGVSEPKLIHEVEPEFSEAARKAKFSGNVEVYLYIDAQGNPSRVRCARDVGMGLCEKAVDAVRQYKFKPAIKDGNPVTVDMFVDVNFNIF